jgi:hypothetical protein
MVIFCFQNIEKNSNAIKNISRSGVTFTATKLDNTTFTFTQQDNNTTYANYVGATTAASGTAGLVPAASTANRLKFLRGDATWQVPTNTTYATATTTANGLMSSSDKIKLDKFAIQTAKTSDGYSYDRINFRGSDILTGKRLYIDEAYSKGSAYKGYSLLADGAEKYLAFLEYSSAAGTPTVVGSVSLDTVSVNKGTTGLVSSELSGSNIYYARFGQLVILSGWVQFKTTKTYSAAATIFTGLPAARHINYNVMLVPQSTTVTEFVPCVVNSDGKLNVDATVKVTASVYYDLIGSYFSTSTFTY